MAAPLTLVEYGDYECSYCGAAELIIKRLMGTFGGRLRFVFRNFPRVEVHPMALEAAAVAELASDLGAFWTVHDALFENQNRLGFPLYESLFTTNGLPAGRVREVLREGTYTHRVQLHREDGLRSGVNGTPTFFINRHRYEGWHEYDALFDALSDALKHVEHWGGWRAGQIVSRLF
jgi:protein-disulfide isomerase